MTRQGILKTNIDARPIKGLDYMVQSNMLLNGKRTMDQIRILLAQIKDADNKLLAKRKASSEEAASSALDIIVIGSVVFLVIIIVLFYYIQETFEQQKRAENQVKIANTELEKVLAENRARNWQLTGAGLLNEKMQGQQSEKELGANVLNELCSYTGALTGTFYLYNEDGEVLEHSASYSVNDPAAVKKKIMLSEGWIGQVANDRQPAVIKGKLNDKIELASSLIGETLVESFIIALLFRQKIKRCV